MTGEEFKQRFLPFSRSMYGAALNLTHNAQEAEDIVQDAYLKLWTKRDTLPDMDNTEAYCVALTKNICYDRQRSRHVANADGRENYAQIPSRTNIETETENKNHADIMKRCIAGLPERQQLIVTMRDMDGMTYDEISRYTGMTMTNIRVTLKRARNKLREQFNAIKNYGGKKD